MTKIFLDTANLNDIKEFLSWGIGDGVTTNQKIFLAEGGVDFEHRVVDICELNMWPVSVETTSKGLNDLIFEANTFASWHPNVVVKIAMDKDGTGLKAISRLADAGVKTNATCMVTLNQLALAEKAGATYVSLFYNRARDAGVEPLKTLHAWDYMAGHTAQVIVGSIRRPTDVEEIMGTCADIITIPPKILREMPYHPKTEETIAEFDAAWQEFLAKK